jgi:hypothetical protein
MGSGGAQVHMRPWAEIPPHHHRLGCASREPIHHLLADLVTIHTDGGPDYSHPTTRSEHLEGGADDPRREAPPARVDGRNSAVSCHDYRHAVRHTHGQQQSILGRHQSIPLTHMPAPLGLEHLPTMDLRAVGDRDSWAADGLSRPGPYVWRCTGPEIKGPTVRRTATGEAVGPGIRAEQGLGTENHPKT